MVIRANVNSQPLDDDTVNDFLEDFQNTCFLFMRSEANNFKLDKSKLIHVSNDPQRTLNEKIVLGFCMAMKETEELYGPKFSDFLLDPQLNNFKRNILMCALQAFADRYYDIYCLYLLTSDGAISFKGKTTSKHCRSLGVYFNCTNVYGIVDVSRLFKFYNSVFYCPNCRTSVNEESSYKHNNKCTFKCPHCCMYGYDFPCAEQKNVEIICNKCNRSFYNKTCFEKHKLHTCSKVKRCILCKESYVIEWPGFEHICHSVYCKSCFEIHRKKDLCVRHISSNQ